MKQYDITTTKNGHKENLIGVSAKTIRALQLKGYEILVTDDYEISEEDYNSTENKHSLKW